MKRTLSPFKWRHYAPDIILLCVRWYCRCQLSYRDLEEMMRERGLTVDHVAAFIRAASALTITAEAAVTARSVTGGVLGRMRPILRSTTCWRVEWCPRKNRPGAVSAARASDPREGHRGRKSAADLVRMSGSHSRICGK